MFAAGRNPFYHTTELDCMGSIYSFFLLALLASPCERSIPTGLTSGYWPGNTVVVECVNEPGMESMIFNSLMEYPVRSIQLRASSCCLQIKATLAFRSKELNREIEYRLRAATGVLRVTIK